MKEEKVGQVKDELEVIDFDLEEPVENVVQSSTEPIQVEHVQTPVQSQVEEKSELFDIPDDQLEEMANDQKIDYSNFQDNTKNDKTVISRTEKIVDGMQNFVAAITEPKPVEPSKSFGEIIEQVNEKKKPIDKIKVLFKEKRSRALLSLIFWIIFMAAVIGLVNGGTHETLDPVESKPNIDGAVAELGKMNNYGYSIVVVDNDTTNIIAGNYFENRTLFTVNGVQYYLENNVYSKVVNNQVEETELTLNFELEKLSPFHLSKILEQSEILENIEDNKGNITGRTYTINAQKLVSYLYNEEIQSDKDVKIAVRYEDDNISSVDINMTEIEEALPTTHKASSLSITYRNIGKITANDVTYDISKLNLGSNDYYNGPSESEKEPVEVEGE